MHLGRFNRAALSVLTSALTLALSKKIIHYGLSGSDYA